MDVNFLQQLSSVTSSMNKAQITSKVGNSNYIKSDPAPHSSHGFPWYWILIGLVAIIFIFIIAFYCIFKIYVEGDWELRETDTQRQANQLSQMKLGSTLSLTGSVQSNNQNDSYNGVVTMQETKQDILASMRRKKQKNKKNTNSVVMKEQFTNSLSDL